MFSESSSYDDIIVDIISNALLNIFFYEYYDVRPREEKSGVTQ